MNGKSSMLGRMSVPVLASIAYFAVLIAMATLLRPFPIDETRYLTVAWEMWHSGNYLVPHLNGLPYHHKPPLLFWLINLSWSVFGVSLWAALLVSALAGMLGIWLLVPMSRLLWPERDKGALLAPWLLATSLIWMMWSTFIVFDLLVAVCAEIAIIGILLAWRGRPIAGWSLSGLGIGLGVLAKGPVILVFVLPVALFAPLWMKTSRPSIWSLWYGGVLYALILGAGIGLSWALPAANAGGEEYRNAILWGQTAGRVVNSFAHARPVWWYLPILPVLLYPWILWRPLWRALQQRLSAGLDSGERLILIFTGTALLIFSLISGKQIHYLVPLFPMLALLAAHAMTMGKGRISDDIGKDDVALMLAPGILLGGALAMVRYLPLPGKYAWVRELSPLWGVLIVVAPLLLVPARNFVGKATGHAIWPGVISVLLFMSLYSGVVRVVSEHYDITPMARIVAQLQATGRAIAFVGPTYNGEFNFTGRMHKPMTVVHPRDRLQWMAEHPDGLIVERLNRLPPQGLDSVIAITPYKRTYMVLHDQRLPVGDYK